MANIILFSAFKNIYPSVVGFMILLLQKNARRRGRRDSRLDTVKHQAGPLTHGGDHTGRMVRSEGEAGRRVHRCRSGQHVAGVAEGRDVAERRHVSGESGWVERAALGEVLQRVMHLFALFGFARHFSVSGLDAFLLHSQGSVNLNRDRSLSTSKTSCLFKDFTEKIKVVHEAGNKGDRNFPLIFMLIYLL